MDPVAAGRTELTPSAANQRVIAGGPLRIVLPFGQLDGPTEVFGGPCSEEVRGAQAGTTGSVINRPQPPARPVPRHASRAGRRSNPRFATSLGTPLDCSWPMVQHGEETSPGPRSGRTAGSGRQEGLPGPDGPPSPATAGSSSTPMEGVSRSSVRPFAGGSVPTSGEHGPPMLATQEPWPWGNRVG